MQSRLHVERRLSYPKHRIDRRFEPFLESRGPQTSGVLLVLFVQAKRIKPFPFRNFLTAESMPLSGQHAARAFWFFLQKQKERKTVPFREHFTCFFKSRTKGASGRRPLPKKHAARLFCRLRRISLLLPQQSRRCAAFPAAKPPYR